MAEPARRARRAAFLDRDGTINEDVNYLRDPSQVRLLPGAAEALKRLRDSGFQIIVASNQSGVARGMLTEQTLAEIHRELLSQLAAQGATVDAIYYCPHLPGSTEAPYGRECDCRKPAPGLLLRAARERNLDLGRSVMIGDSERDVRAGLAAGCRAVLIAPSRHVATAAETVVPSLLDAARWVIEHLGEPRCDEAS